MDGARAAWVARRLLPTGGGDPVPVGALVPVGFGAYARLRHPGSMGSLPVEQLAALCDVLAAHTRTPEGCTFDLGAAWPGWREPWPDGRGEGAGEPQPGSLVAAPLDEALPLGYCDAPGWWWARSPAAFWPDDRAWFVATAPDLTDTLVGGSVALREDLVAAADLDAWPARATDAARA